MAPNKKSKATMPHKDAHLEKDTTEPSKETLPLLEDFGRVWQPLSLQDHTCSPAKWRMAEAELGSALDRLHYLLSRRGGEIDSLPDPQASWLRSFRESAARPRDETSYLKLAMLFLQPDEFAQLGQFESRSMTKEPADMIVRAGAERGQPLLLEHFLATLGESRISLKRRKELVSHLVDLSQTKHAMKSYSTNSTNGSTLQHPPTAVVFHGMQMPANRDDAKELSRFQALLRQPLPLVGEIDSDRAATELLRDAPWLEKAITSLQRHIDACLMGWGGLTLAPLLLVGPPGTGKTWFAQKLGDLLSLPNFVIPAAGARDNMALKGTARGWGTARAGQAVEFIAEQQVANPLIVVDEIDKVSSSTHNGNLHQTLHQLLSRNNARHWVDEFLLGRCDLSHVSWICTANSTQQIPASLLSRFQVVHVPAAGPSHRVPMLHSVLRELEKEWQTGHPLHMVLDQAEWNVLCQRARTPRQAEHMIERLMARKIQGQRQHPH